MHVVVYKEFQRSALFVVLSNISVRLRLSDLFSSASELFGTGLDLCMLSLYLYCFSPATPASLSFSAG